MDEPDIGKMTSDVGDTLQDIKRTLSDIRVTGERRALPQSSNATITVSAGGAGMWVAVTAALVMAVGLLIAVPVGVGAFLFQQGQITKLQQGENAIRARFERDGQPLPPRTEGKKNE